MKLQKQIELYDALKRISCYMQPETLKANSEKLYGVGAEEAVSMAYENIITEAKTAIKGVRRPKLL
jgi:hypothetical protein